MFSWRNWYTRYVEVVVPKGLQVRVLSRTPELRMDNMTEDLWAFGYINSQGLVKSIVFDYGAKTIVGEYQINDPEADDQFAIYFFKKDPTYKGKPYEGKFDLIYPIALGFSDKEPSEVSSEFEKNQTALDNDTVKAYEFIDLYMNDDSVLIDFFLDVINDYNQQTLN